LRNTQSCSQREPELRCLTLFNWRFRHPVLRIDDRSSTPSTPATSARGKTLRPDDGGNVRVGVKRGFRDVTLRAPEGATIGDGGRGGCWFDRIQTYHQFSNCYFGDVPKAVSGG